MTAVIEIARLRTRPGVTPTEFLKANRRFNSEGEYVEWIHDAAEWADGVIVNPGAWTHYSWAIHDALELVSGPIVEVHLSNVAEREEWRRVSVVSDLVAARIVGKGPDGYREALAFLCTE